MPLITALLHLLGSYGALTNVRTVLDQRQGEDWLVASLALRLDERERTGVARTPTAADAA